MSKEVISDKQAITLVTLYLLGSTLIIGTAGQAKNDMWISILLAMIATIPVYMIYSRILSLFPGKGFIEILEQVFGRLGGKAIGLLYIWFSFYLCALVLLNFGHLVSIMGLPETPMMIPLSLFILLCIWGVKLGIEVLGRWSESAVLILYATFIVFGVLSLSKIKFENLRPILYNGLPPVIGGAFYAFSYPFAEAVVLLFVFGSLKDSKSSYKVYFKGLLFAGITLVYVSLRNTMILGVNQLDLVYFPSYVAVSRISIGTFLQRLEISVIVVFLISEFVKITMCLLATSIGVAGIFKLKDYRKIVTPIGLLILNMSYFVFNNPMDMFAWNQKYWTIYAFPFQVILPIIIWIMCERKYRRTLLCHSERSEESKS